MKTSADLIAAGQRLAALLKQQDTTLVLAESCTGGLIAATLAMVPGISRHLCGSAVVYQVETKAAWLGVSPALLVNPGPVSAEVAEAMASGVLSRTAQARIAASTTGHLGPDAPAAQDGLIYAAVARRDGADGPAGQPYAVVVREYRLATTVEDGTSGTGETLRTRRQREAAIFVLSLLCSVLEGGLDRHSVAT